ncbi:MAG: PstS family phosphate ABC transporter substrate-binding protein [Christensenellales bacterium]
MKKGTIQTIALLLVLLLGAGCAENSNTVEKKDTKPSFTWEEFPKIDGSIDAMPLTAALLRSVCGATVEQSEDYTIHTGAAGGYYQLGEKEADLVIAPDLTTDFADLISYYDMKLTLRPLLTDAAVFLVPEDSAVDSLTVDQLKSILSGETKSWESLGGAGSLWLFASEEGSTSYQGVKETVLGGTGGIVGAAVGWNGEEETLAPYRNTEGALGFSTYYYTGKILQNEGYKLLKVNGVAPSPETVASGEYPLCFTLYAVYDSGLSEGSNTVRLVNYLVSGEGKAYLESIGYVPAS